MPTPSVKDFERALTTLGRPRGKQPLFLQAHATATGRALNMRSIAKAAGYKSYRAANLQYGILADKIAQRLGLRGAGLDLLVSFIAPKGKSQNHISNDEWILVMRPNFARALARANWI